MQTEVAKHEPKHAKAKESAKTKEAVKSKDVVKRKGGASAHPVASAMLDIESQAFSQAATSAETYDFSQARLFALSTVDNQIVEVPISQLMTDENVRGDLDTESPAMIELAQSIKTHGMMHTPVISVIKNATGDYSISLISGKRRVTAQKMLGERYIRCLHRVVADPLERHVMSIVENKHRTDISTLDTALAYKALRDTYKLKKNDLAKLCLLDRGALRKYLNIASWSKEAHDYVRSNEKYLGYRSLFTIASTKRDSAEILGRLKEAVKAAMSEQLLKEQKANKKASDKGKPLPYPTAGLSDGAKAVASDALEDKKVYRRIMGAAHVDVLSSDLDQAFKDEKIPEAQQVVVRRLLIKLNLLPA